jgi:dTDP-4-dehydrorhamnose reductase
MKPQTQTWLVLGAGGMLGTDMVAVARERGHDVVAANREHTDVADPHALAAAVTGVDVVVNCSAYTAVDEAEAHEADAHLLNAVAPELIARACVGAGSRLVHVSTDYVFAGDATEPYAENSERAPISAYGRTKAEGERRVEASGADALIVRTAWLYGEHGASFPKTIARISREHEEISVVDDQHGQPTWTMDLADLIVRLVDADAPAGIYHGTSSGETTWFGFAQEVVNEIGANTRVLSTDSNAYKRPAPRPAWSVLDHAALGRTGVKPIGDWRQRWLVAAQAIKF